MVAAVTRVVPPRPRASGTSGPSGISALLTEMGYPELQDLDEGSEQLADSNDQLFEEIAAFARRGWTTLLDAETGFAYEPAEYARVLARVVRPAGIHAVTFDDEAGVLTIGARGARVAADARVFRVERPEQDDDWLDVTWLLATIDRVLAGTGYCLAIVNEADPHAMILAAVPDVAWNAIVAGGFTGIWIACSSDDPDAGLN